MGKRLVIAEKPSVGRDIAAALGGFTDHKEWMESDDYVVTWAVGHLLELDEPQDYDKKYASWAVKNLPIVPETFQIHPKEGQKKRLDAIDALGHRKDVDGVINACDAGREGELIFRRIVEYLSLGKLPQQRLWLQSMTKEAIRGAFQSLRPGEDLMPLADAAWCRSVGDWLVGMNATRALTQRLKSRADKEAWSAGRVQTPTLNLLVARERQILAHIPRPYWELLGRFRKDAQEWEARFYDPDAKAVRAEEDDEDADPDAKPSRLFDRERVERLVAELSKATIGETSEKRKKSRQTPPLLFDLTTLQREANRRFSFSAKRTLDAAQRLYEGHKLVTYPRTDSRYLPADYAATLQDILKGLGRATDWRDLAAEVAAAPQNLDRLLDSTKISDHFAIVPTGNVPEGPLRGDDERIYELIVRQFLAAMMGPATWSQVERIVAVPAGRETARFRATSRTLEEPGYYRALGIPTEQNPLPPLVPGGADAQGVRSDVIEVREESKETKPPGRYSEAQMLRMMETAGERVDAEELSDAMKGRGIGTPATRAEIIEGLVHKHYVHRIDSRLGPTSKAMRLIDILERVQAGPLASPKLTGEWEYALAQVEAGKLSRTKFLERLVGFTREVTERLVHFEHDDLFAKDAALGACPACGVGQVVESTWGYRCTQNDGEEARCAFMIWKDRAGRYVDRGLVATLLRDRQALNVIGFVDRGGRSLTASIFLEADTDPEKAGRWVLRLEYGAPSGAPGTPEGPEEPTGALCACPNHEGCEIIETNRRYVCKQLLEGAVKKGPVMPKVVCHREISSEEATVFFATGQTPLLEQFISKRGRPFRAWLVRKDEGRHGFQFPARGTDAPQSPEEAAARRPARGKGAKASDDATVTAKPAKGKGGKGAKATTKPSKASGKGAKGDVPSNKAAGKGAKGDVQASKSAGKGAKGGKAGKSPGKGGKAGAKSTPVAG